MYTIILFSSAVLQNKKKMENKQTQKIRPTNKFNKVKTNYKINTLLHNQIKNYSNRSKNTIIL